ncbi:DNA-binding transcriptional regulator DicC [Yersinia enterocolitica]|uniref:Cro/CI family transcriptional regulator n=1 Tax=Yersinia proxima TaxID=2890316 RepID=A0ABW9EXL1_9GAMM|nr:MULTISPECIES: Cro/CI family transcriptional regulator [Yersinia]EKN3386177.1 cell division protein [Yersinia enterocolitica]EKN3564692.1 cell division protein [Yersinia enterocolitica]EKN3766706.1 cell division protein [Yersinia enterocolitica]EKN4081645.1 cell division protein [Yersinia enterocolitica]EKN4887372.1 cell division protein [Yersinia enterocolitica]
MTTDELENYFGDANLVAEFYGVSPEAIYQWRKRPGRLIPKGRAAEAALRTDGALKFNPALYKNNRA